VSIVVILIGLNQYESYKLNSRANNAIDSFTGSNETYNFESEMIKTSVFIIKSGIAMSKSMNLLEGGKEDGFIENGCTVNLTSQGSEKLFDKILEYKVKQGNSSGEWSKEGSYYIYHLKDGTVEFIYNNTDCSFKCVNGCSILY